jgi:hypothetical protein
LGSIVARQRRFIEHTVATLVELLAALTAPVPTMPLCLPGLAAQSPPRNHSLHIAISPRPAAILIPFRHHAKMGRGMQDAAISAKRALCGYDRRGWLRFRNMAEIVAAVLPDR